MKRTALACFLIALLLAAAHGVAQSQAAKQESKPAAKQAAGAGEVSKGKSLYADHCEICHYSANRAKKVGPGLKGIYKRGKFADGRKVDDATMRQWIGVTMWTQ